MGQPNPTEIGKLIDEACEKLVSLERERNEAREKYDTLAVENMLVVNKLCKERDEVFQELEEYRSIAENIGAEKAVSEKEKAIRERDEAREKAERYRLEANAMMLQRDEAREEIRKVAVYLRKYNHDDAAESLEVFLESTK